MNTINWTPWRRNSEDRWPTKVKNSSNKCAALSCPQFSKSRKFMKRLRMKVALRLGSMSALNLYLVVAEVDISFGTGLLAFDEVCKRFEAMAIRQEDELKIAYYRLQVGVCVRDFQEFCLPFAPQDRSRILFEQLEDAYTRREKLWSDFEANIEECGRSLSGLSFSHQVIDIFSSFKCTGISGVATRRSRRSHLSA